MNCPNIIQWITKESTKKSLKQILISGVDALLIKKSMRKCRIIGKLDFGEKMANSSKYTGILGM